MDDHAVDAGALFLKQPAEPAAFIIRQVLRLQQGIAEGQPGGNAVFPEQGKHFLSGRAAFLQPAAGPQGIRRRSVNGADARPRVKEIPVLRKDPEKHLIEIEKLKQARQMKHRLLFSGHTPSPFRERLIF